MTKNNILEWFKKIHPANFFLVMAAVFGSAFLVITPPFQVPDEVNHFYRSYQIADGHLLADTLDHRLGGYVPVNIVETVQPFLTLRFNPNAKTHYNTIRRQFDIPLNKEDKTFVDFPNTALYSPVSYHPQACAIFILKSFNASPLVIFYGARFFTLLVWLLCVWFAIRMIPIFKWLFTLLALLPMSIFTNMSLSADVVTNLLAFLMIAYFFKMAYGDQPVRVKQLLFILGLTVLLASAKVVYIPLALLFLIIPIRNFKNRWHFVAHFALILLVGAATAVFWSRTINSLYIPYQDYNVGFRDGIDLVSCANMHEQIQYIFSHPFYLVQVFFHSIDSTFHMYQHGYIGTFGWLDTELPVWVINTSYLFIVVTALLENKKNISIKVYQRAILFLSLIAGVAFLLLSQILTWVCVGGKAVTIIQGRYLIPVFPLLFMLFNCTKCYHQIATRIIVILMSVSLLCFSFYTLYDRYFFISHPQQVTITCDAENTNNKGLLTSSVPKVLLGSSALQCTKHARSGKYSLALSSQNPYGFNYITYSSIPGDEFIVEAWRLGQTGEIIMAGDLGKAFYLSSSRVVETDSRGWEKLQLSYVLRQYLDGKDIWIYLYNNKNDTSYFDDLTITRVQHLRP